METLDYIILLLYFLLSIGVAFSVNKAKSVLDFSLGNKSIPGIIVFSTLSATLIGPGYSMGVVNNGYSGGFIWFFVFLAFSIQTILSGKYLAPKIREIPNVSTIADIIRIKYGEPARLLTGVISFISLFGFFAAIAGATGDIVQALTGFDRILSIYICVGFVILFSTIGGVKSVVITDTFQFAVLVIAIPLAFIFLVNSNEAASLTSLSEVLTWNTDITPFAFVGLFINFFFGEALIPPYVHRILISKNKNEASKGYIYAGLFSVVWFFICVFVGNLGAELYPNTDNVFINIVKNHLPIGITGIAIAAMISIILSTLSSLLNSAVVTLNEDLLKFKGQFWSNKTKELNGLRYSGVIIGILSIFFAIKSPNIIDGLLIVYSLWGASVVVPFALGILLKKTSPAAGFMSMATGIIISASWKWLLNEPMGVSSIVPGLLGNITCYCVIHFATINKTTN